MDFVIQQVLELEKKNKINFLDPQLHTTITSNDLSDIDEEEENEVRGYFGALQQVDKIIDILDKGHREMLKKIKVNPDLDVKKDFFNFILEKESFLSSIKQYSYDEDTGTDNQSYLEDYSCTSH